MRPFEFATAARIVFGPGTSADLPSIVASFGRRALVVTGRSRERLAPLLAAIAAAGSQVTTVAAAGEPEIDAIEHARAEARGAGVDVVVGIGGGSVLDTAKAIAALVPNDGPIRDYLEVVGRGQPLRHPALPCIAVPTTAGTGSEVTRNAVIGAPGERVKVSLRHAFLLPRVALVDPDLTSTAPKHVAASTGLDALTQLVEPYLSTRATPMTDALCVAGIRLAAEALPDVVRDSSNAAARASMSLASLWSGMALANAGLGAVHGFAGPIGGRIGAPHGAICAALLPHVMAVNLRALDARAPASPGRARFDELGRLLTNRPATGADGALEWVSSTVSRLDVAPLRALGVRADDVPVLVQQAARASSMKANPISLTSDELTEILERALR